MSEIVNKIKQELANFNEKKKALVEDLRKEFPSLFKELFEKSKKIESISWTQYTPYFNDGDECIFEVHTDYLDVNGEDVRKLDWYDYRIKYEKYHKELTEEGKVDWAECRILLDFKELLETIPTEFYEDLFGDHAQVTVYKDGRIEVEEYDHD